MQLLYHDESIRNRIELCARFREKGPESISFLGKDFPHRWRRTVQLVRVCPSGSALRMLPGRADRLEAG